MAARSRFEIIRDLLQFLVENPGARMWEVNENVLSHMRRARQYVDFLQERGLIAIERTSARSMSLTVTDAGKEALNLLNQVYGYSHRRW